MCHVKEQLKGSRLEKRLFQVTGRSGVILQAGHRQAGQRSRLDMQAG